MNADFSNHHEVSLHTSTQLRRHVRQETSTLKVIKCLPNLSPKEGKNRYYLNNLKRYPITNAYPNVEKGGLRYDFDGHFLAFFKIEGSSYLADFWT